MSDFSSAKATSFSPAHKSKQARSVDPNSTEFFSHRAPSAADASRAERQGSGPARDVWDQKFYSNSRPSGIKPTHNGPIHRDSSGHPIYSQEISSEAMETADRIRRRER